MVCARRERLLQKRAGTQASASALVGQLLVALQQQLCPRVSLIPHPSPSRQEWLGRQSAKYKERVKLRGSSSFMFEEEYLVRNS